jgi:hypothetical protein
MKIKTLIKRLQKFSEKKGNVEVFIADRYISCNHQYGQIKDFNFFDCWYETDTGDEKGILLGQVDEEEEFEDE